jgi:hypothetical protein
MVNEIRRMPPRSSSRLRREKQSIYDAVLTGLDADQTDKTCPLGDPSRIIIQLLPPSPTIAATAPDTLVTADISDTGNIALTSQGRSNRSRTTRSNPPSLNSVSRTTSARTIDVPGCVRWDQEELPTRSGLRRPNRKRNAPTAEHEAPGSPSTSSRSVKRQRTEDGCVVVENKEEEEEEEDMTDQAFMRRHHRFEKQEKRERLRENEIFAHRIYREQLRLEELQHKALNERLYLRRTTVRQPPQNNKHEPEPDPNADGLWLRGRFVSATSTASTPARKTSKTTKPKQATAAEVATETAGEKTNVTESNMLPTTEKNRKRVKRTTQKRTLSDQQTEATTAVADVEMKSEEHTLLPSPPASPSPLPQQDTQPSDNDVDKATSVRSGRKGTSVASRRVARNHRGQFVSLDQDRNQAAKRSTVRRSSASSRPVKASKTRENTQHHLDMQCSTQSSENISCTSSTSSSRHRTTKQKRARLRSSRASSGNAYSSDEQDVYMPSSSEEDDENVRDTECIASRVRRRIRTAEDASLSTRPITRRYQSNAAR